METGELPGMSRRFREREAKWTETQKNAADRENRSKSGCRIQLVLLAHDGRPL